MSNVIEIHFSRRDRVVISSAMIVETTVHSCRGVVRFDHPLRRKYFVDVVEADGGSICMWDGDSFDGAMQVARDCSADWGNAPIIDRVRA